MPNQRQAYTANHQRGAALLTTLVFLTILTIIGLTSMRNSSLEQKMSTNMQELNHAFNLAESGLVAGRFNPGTFNSTTADQGETQVSDFANTADIYLCGSSTPCVIGSSKGNAAVFNKYLGRGTRPPPNYSLNQGVANHFYAITSKGTVNKASVINETVYSVIGADQ